MENHLSVTGPLKNRAIRFQFAPQLDGVGQIAVVSNSYVPFAARDRKRLGVLNDGFAGRGISGMPNCLEVPGN